MDQLQEALKDLRDIHQPDPVSIWPLAPGWWILIILVPVLIFLIRFLMKRKRKPNYKKLASDELQSIIADFEIQRNSHKTLGEISLFIRKVLVAKNGNAEVAGLIGEDWLDYLDSVSGTDLFSNGGASIIATSPYRKQDEDLDIQDLITATQSLVKKL